eukprot:742859-Pelagomonas_calceolata.AAC.2
MKSSLKAPCHAMLASLWLADYLCRGMYSLFHGGGQLAGADFCACSSSWSVWWGHAFQDGWSFLNARGQTWTG